MEIPWAGTQGLSRSRSPPLVRPHDRRARGQAEKLEPQHTWLRLHPLLCHPQSDPHSCPGQVCSKVLGPRTLPSSCCLAPRAAPVTARGQTGQVLADSGSLPTSICFPPRPTSAASPGTRCPPGLARGTGGKSRPERPVSEFQIQLPEGSSYISLRLEGQWCPAWWAGAGEGEGPRCCVPSLPCPRCAPSSRLWLPGSPYIRRPPVLLVITRSAIRGTFQYF